MVSLETLRRIRAFVFDMDGVLTDGGLWVMPDGEWVRRMHIRDGYALQLAVKRGYHVCVLSGSSSEPVKERLKRLGVTDVVMGVEDKAMELLRYASHRGIDTSEVLYMGDDMPDLAAMALAGISGCPVDACREVREAADHVCTLGGGEGCVREMVETVMRASGRWEHAEGTRSI